MNDLAERAKTTFHSTSLQAATIAKKAGVDKLIVGHFLHAINLKPLLDEARTVFKIQNLPLKDTNSVLSKFRNYRNGRFFRQLQILKYT